MVKIFKSFNVLQLITTLVPHILSLYINNCQVYRQGQGPSCEQCNLGYTLSIDGTCVDSTTIINCQLYSNTTNSPQKCNTCQTGAYLSPNNLYCYNSMPGCISYNDAGLCQQCHYTWGQLSNSVITCQNTINFCKIYDTSFPTTCQQCFVGRTLVSNDCTTKNVADNCDFYNETNPNICVQCQNGYFQQEGSSYCYSSINYCIKYSKINNTLCITCQQGYYLSGDQLTCSNLNWPNCLVSSIDGFCILCEDGYTLNDSTHNCQPIIPNCLVYTQPFILSNAKCQQCKSGYYINIMNNACFNNIPSCILYVSYDFCQLCLYTDPANNYGVAYYNSSTQHCLSNIGHVINCQAYFAINSTCTKCYYPFTLNASGNVCVSSPIPYCQQLMISTNSSFSLMCKNCWNQHNLDQYQQNCYNSIEGCTQYQFGNPAVCLDCTLHVSGLVLNKTACINIVQFCRYYTYYQNQTLCIQCWPATSIVQNQCHPYEIYYCKVKEGRFCIQCQEFYVLSYNQLNCIDNYQRTEWCTKYHTDLVTCQECYSSINYCWNETDSLSNRQYCKPTKGLILDTANNRCICQPGVFFPKQGMVNGRNTFYCELCQGKCGTCNQDGTCQTCKGDRQNPPSCTCLDGFYDDNINENCQVCPSRCQTCKIALKCDTCLPFRDILQDCICVSNTVQVGNNCVCLSTAKAYNDLCILTVPFGTYLEFIDINSIEHYKDCPAPCETCNLINSSIECLTCLNSTGTMAVNGICLCNSNSYLSPFTNQCEACPFKCSSCLQDGQTCIMCKGDRNPLTNCACPMGFFDDGKQLNCLKCPYRCQSCVTNSACQTCKPGRDKQTDCNCTQPGSYDVGSELCECEQGYYSYQSSCVTECPNGTYSDALVCHSCPTQCLSCNLVGSDIRCLACPTNMTSMMGKCQCQIGMYLEPKLQTCIMCPWKCDPIGGCDYDQINNVVVCALCRGDRLISQQCQCPEGTYDSVGSQSCVTCPAQCQTCNTLQRCLSCSGRLRDILNNCVCKANSSPNSHSICTCNINSVYNTIIDECQSSCPDGTYQNAVDASCYLCSANCLTCVNSADQCTSTVSCMPNEFFNRYKNACVQCFKPCSTCIDANTCVTCILDYILYDNQCVLQCPQGTYSTIKNGLQICQECSILCLTCSEQRDHCLICKSFAYKYQDYQCLLDCPLPTYKDMNSSTCQPCNQFCKTCFGANANECLSCFAPPYLLNSQCYDKCPIGYIQNEQTRSCQVCTGADKNQPNCKNLVTAIIKADLQDNNLVNIFFSSDVRVNSPLQLEQLIDTYMQCSTKAEYQSKMNFQSHTQLQIKIQRNNQYSECQLFVRFSNVSAFRDNYNNPIDQELQKKSLNVILRPQQAIIEPQVFQDNSKIVIFFLGGILIPFYLFGFSLSASILIDSCQLITIFLFLKIYLPQNIELFLRALMIFNLDFIPSVAEKRVSSIIFMFFEEEFNQPKSIFGQEVLDQEPYQRLAERGSLNSSFFVNGFGKLQLIALFWLIMFILQITVHFMKKRLGVTGDKGDGNSSYRILVQIFEHFQYTAVLSAHKIVFIPLIFAVALQLKNYSEVSYINPTSYFIAIVTLIYIAAYLYWIFRICFRNISKAASKPQQEATDNKQEKLTDAKGEIDKQDTPFQLKYQLILFYLKRQSEFPKTFKQFIQAFHPFLNQIFQILQVSLIVAMYNYSLLLLYILIVLQAFWIFISSMQPFKMFSKNVLLLTNQIISFIVLIMFFILSVINSEVLASSSDNDDDRKIQLYQSTIYIGWLCIFLTGFLLLSNLIFNMYFLYDPLMQFIKFLRSKYGSQQIKVAPLRERNKALANHFIFNEKKPFSYDVNSNQNIQENHQFYTKIHEKLVQQRQQCAKGEGIEIDYDEVFSEILVQQQEHQTLVENELQQQANQLSYFNNLGQEIKDIIDKLKNNLENAENLENVKVLETTHAMLKNELKVKLDKQMADYTDFLEGSDNEN